MAQWNAEPYGALRNRAAPYGAVRNLHKIHRMTTHPHWYATRARNRTVPFTCVKSEGLSWSDLEKAARPKLLGACPFHLREVGRSDLV